MTCHRCPCTPVIGDKDGRVWCQFCWSRQPGYSHTKITVSRLIPRGRKP